MNNIFELYRKTGRPMPLRLRAKAQSEDRTLPNIPVGRLPDEQTQPQSQDRKADSLKDVAASSAVTRSGEQPANGGNVAMGERRSVTRLSRRSTDNDVPLISLPVEAADDSLNDALPTLNVAYLSPPEQPTPAPTRDGLQPTSGLLSSMSTRSSISIATNEDSSTSRLSFMVQERLHGLRTDIKRRTSVLKDHIQKDPTPDQISLTSTIAGLSCASPWKIGDKKARGSGDTEAKRWSLTSFIGIGAMPRLPALKHLQPTATTSNGVPLSRWQKAVRKTTTRKWLPDCIEPNSKTYLAWLALVALCFLYNAYGIPLRAAYPYQHAGNMAYWILFDYLCDIIYIFDTFIVKPRLCAIKGGLLITNRKELRKHYFMTFQCKLDLLSLLPTDFLYLAVGFKPLVRLPRLFKVMTFFEFFRYVDNLVANPYIIRIGRTLSYMIYIVHCNSCVYYTFSAWQGFGQLGVWREGKWQPNRWVYNGEGVAYIRCFYFTTKLATSIGNNPSPTNVVEFIYMLSSWMMGVFVFVLLLGQIRDIVATANRNREMFRNTMDAALHQCKVLKVPKQLENQVRDWFTYTWQHQKTLNENQLIDKLPRKLQTDLAIAVHYNTLSKDCDRALLRDLVLKLTPVLFLPGSFICQKGEVGKEMYIVSKGVLEVVGGPNNNTVFATLTEGSYFGEISLLAIGGGNRRTANVRSKGFSNLFILSKEDLNEAIKDYPDAQRMLKRKARKMLKKDETKRQKSEEDLAKACEVAPKDKTPRMLDAVVRVLGDKTPVARRLRANIEREKEREEAAETGREMADSFDDDLIQLRGSPNDSHNNTLFVANDQNA